MKVTTTILAAALALSACTTYQGPKANCFGEDTVARSSNNISTETLSFSAGSNSMEHRAGKKCAFEPFSTPKGH